jgi:hypothetical protein
MRAAAEPRRVRLQSLVLDTWTPLSHKEALEQPSAIVATWVSQEDRRRLASYMLLGAFADNVGREYLRATSQTDKDAHREYGDAELLVHRVVSGVLGDDLVVGVDGADDDLPESPVVPDEPAPPAEDAGPIVRASYEAQMRVWEQRARAAIDEWEASWLSQPALVERQEWLRDWADRELLHQRVWEGESEAVGLGDGVYVLGLSARAGRPVIRVYDPGFYFPVLDDEAAAHGFPTTVHLMWETDEDGDGVADHVRRISYTLGPIRPVLTDDGTGRVVPAVAEATPDGLVFLRPAGAERPDLAPGDMWAADGTIVRRYPWAADVDSGVTCFMSDATWRIRDIGTDLQGRRVFPPERAMYAINEDGLVLRELDLRHDFIPVVHVPNTPASQQHFGRSVLSRVLQLLDDIADTDTDLQAAAALAGTPMVTVSGATLPAKLTVAPGAAYGLGVNGRMDSIDLSASVEALMKLIDVLLDRLSVNAQVPGELVGRVNAASVESGVSRALKLGPFRSLVAMLRLVREPKYRILLRMVQRLAQVGGYLAPGPTPEARLVFGSFLPADRKAVVDEVVALLTAKAISRATALRLLAAAGLEIEDVAAELSRIAETDFDGANELMDAINDEDAVRHYLGVPGVSPNPADTGDTAPPPAGDRTVPPVIDLPAPPA